MADDALPLAAVTGRPTFWSLRPMPPKPYALFRTAEIATERPLVFDTAAQLAAYFERLRGDAALELEEVEDLEFRGDPNLHVGVRIWSLDLSNARDRPLGLAWLDGRGRDALEPALRRARRKYDRRAA